MSEGNEEIEVILQTISIPKDSFIKNCPLVEEICQNKEKDYPGTVLKEIEYKFPQFFANFKIYFKDVKSVYKMEHFRILVGSVIQLSSKKDISKEGDSPSIRKLDLDLLSNEEKGGKFKLVNQSFEMEQVSKQSEEKGPSDVAKDSRNSDLHNFTLEKRSYFLFKKVEFLEREMKIYKRDKSALLRKTYQIQDEVRLINNSLRDSSLLELHPEIEKHLELKLYFWSVYRRLRFFARVSDLFRNRFVKVYKKKKVNSSSINFLN